MFNKILVANRGEIACRVIRTAKRLGIKTVAVYSAADSGAQHVSMADEAFAIGPAPARDSYLAAEKLVAVAKRANAEAIHPGYGFLSENAGFARACDDDGIVFIGPPAGAIEAMGSKSAAKSLMQKAGVPVVPGYHGANQAARLLLKEAEKIGFPVMIKASAGGGGKGMRAVENAKAFNDALQAAKREALSSFNDDNVLIEKYIGKPRHMEIQIFCDNHGNAVHLFERDCSIQRRHQKVLEEAPAPGLDNEKRATMGKTAIAAARAIDYAGAGTVEFIVAEDGAFYFMEMNTRLQVEHPVTELITGQDLVEWQLLVAGGESLPATQEQLSINGHALEARIYAEDPGNHFLPSIGRLNHLRFPNDSTHIRVDAGVRQGDSITIHYDPMIAKLIAWGSDRTNCLRRMREALGQTQVAGVITNINFLASVISHEAFQSADFDTGFIERRQADLFPGAVNIDILGLAALHQVLEREKSAADYAATSPDPTSPWHLTDNWQPNLVNEECFRFHDGTREHEIKITPAPPSYEELSNNAVPSNATPSPLERVLQKGSTCLPPDKGGARGIGGTPARFVTDRHDSPLSPPGQNEYLIQTDDQLIRAAGRLDQDNQLTATLDNKRLRVTIIKNDQQLTLFHAGSTHRLDIISDSDHADDREATGNLRSPMPGRIIEVMATQGQQVKQGDALLILEAMKMEHAITAPHDGVVQSLHYSAGDLVDEGVELLLLTDHRPPLH